jgi:hypothetical protein
MGFLEFIVLQMVSSELMDDINGVFRADGFRNYVFFN